MLAAFYYNNHDIRLQEIHTKAGEEEVLLKVMASESVVGRNRVYRVPMPPRVLGQSN